MAAMVPQPSFPLKAIDVKYSLRAINKVGEISSNLKMF